MIRDLFSDEGLEKVVEEIISINPRLRFSATQIAEEIYRKYRVHVSVSRIREILKRRASKGLEVVSEDRTPKEPRYLEEEIEDGGREL